MNKHPHDDGLGDDDLVPLPNKKKKKKEKNPNEVTVGTFPEPELLEKKIGIPAGSYHGTGGDGGVKGTLKGLLGLNKNHPYGKNPDFGYDDKGNLLLKVMKGRNQGKFFKTGYTLDEVKKML